MSASHQRGACCCDPSLTFPLRIILFSLQIERAKTVKAHFVKKVEHEAKEGRKAGEILADGVIVGLGLINRKEG